MDPDNSLGCREGERRLLLSEAAELADILGVSVEMLLKRPDEAGIQRDIANECREIGLMYDEVVWATFGLWNAQAALQGLLDEAERKGVTAELVTAEALREAIQLAPQQALEEVTALDHLDERDRPRTREAFDAMRRLTGG